MSETTQETTQQQTQETTQQQEEVKQINPYTNDNVEKNSKLSATENVSINNQTANPQIMQQPNMQQPNMQQQFVNSQTMQQPNMQQQFVNSQTMQQPSTSLVTQQVGGQLMNAPSIKNNDNMSQIMEVSMDDDIKINRLERFPKLSENEVARMAFILFDEKEAPILKMSSVFYYKPAQTSFLAPKDRELYSKVVDTVGEPSQKFGAIVLKYVTDKQGNLFPNWGFELYAFIFSTDKYPAFKNLHREWGLKNHDIILNCSDSNWQKMSITLARDCLWRNLEPAVVENVIATAKGLHEKQLSKQLGKFMSDQEIMITIGLIKPPDTMGGGQGGGVYNPFGNVGGQTPGQGFNQNQMMPNPGFQGQIAPNNNGGGVIPAGGPAVNLANQVGQGLPQSGQFGHLVQNQK